MRIRQIYQTQITNIYQYGLTEKELMPFGVLIFCHALLHKNLFMIFRKNFNGLDGQRLCNNRKQWASSKLFCYSINTESNTGFLKFIIVDQSKQEKDSGKKMLNLALQYAFQITDARAVQLNVFGENALAKQCYGKVA